MKGPTQANDASAKVRPISSVPMNPPWPDAAFSFVSTPDGIVISNAPSRLKPNTKKTSAMKPFTQGFEPSCTTPAGPRASVRIKAEPAEQNDDAEAERDRLSAVRRAAR